MAVKGLHVFEGLSIPIDYASTQTYALLAKRDGGKTYTTLKLEEQMCDAGLFFVTLDPVGKHWALRAGAGGGARGGKQDVWVLGGNHGDVPLEATSGELIADTVIDHPGRYVLDVSTFDTDAEQDRFALAFAKRLFRRKAKDPGFPLLLILEEAESFIPQTPQSGQQQMLGAYGRIMRQGRNHGLGMLMVAQRAQALNKGVLSQAEVLIVKQMAHNRDIDAVDEWIKSNGTSEQRAELLRSIASLDQDEAYVWSPAWLRTFKRCRVLRRVTFDSSASVKGGQEAKHVELSPLDVAELGSRIEQTAERAKADDPRALHREIAELRRQVQAGGASKDELEGQYRLGWDAARAELSERVLSRVVDLQGLARPLAEQARQTLELVGEVRSEFEDGDVGRAVPPPAPVARPSRPATSRPVRVAPTVESNGAARGGGSSSARQKVLDALAWWEALGVSPVTRLQLAMVAGYHPRTGTFAQALADLAKDAAVEFPDRGMVQMLAAGRAEAHEPGAAPTEEALQEMVYRQVGERREEALRLIVEAYPSSVGRAELAERLGYHPRTGTFAQVLADLKSLGVVSFPRPGELLAASVMFLGGAVRG